MNPKKRVGTVLASLALVLPGAVAISSPAQAAASDCFSGRLCFWEHYEYSGQMGQYSPSTSCYTMGVMNNMATSIYNRSGRNVRVYDGSGCTGDSMLVYDRVSDWHLGSGGVNWNDRITSFRAV